VNYLVPSSTGRHRSVWLKFASASLIALAVAGCGGGSTTGANSPTQLASMTAAQWADAKFNAEVTSVTINASAPVVSFKVTDATGAPVVGLGNTSKSTSAKFASYPNVAFALAKLVPGANGSPSKWVSYNVTTVESTTAPVTASKPTTDNTGTLVDNGDGSYMYTFYRDITKAKDVVAALTLTGNNNAADLGDLTYEPTLTHRLVVQIGGAARGTGKNTANGSDSGVTAADLKNPVNAIYDFIPATGSPVTATDTQREIVAIASCNQCHSKLAIHSGSVRVDTRFCVVCHNDQRKYGNAEAATTATGYSGSTSKIGGKAVGDMPAFIHRLHMGKELIKTGYNYANVPFNEVTYPQPITNCVKCHDGSATAVNKTAQGDNWKNVPSILACGACHDGINFETGLGVTLADKAADLAAAKAVGTTQTGHVGKAQASSAYCALCHKAADIAAFHVTVDPLGSNGRGAYKGKDIPVASQLSMPAGVYKIGFEVTQVTVAGAAGAKKATVVYRILKDGTPVTLNATGYLMDNVDGTPDIYVGYATAQDGLAAPADWNATKSAHIIDIRDAKVYTDGKTFSGTQTGPDASGYYTATLDAIIPDDAKMVTGALGINYNGFVQLGLTAYPNGIRLREPAFAMKTADGSTARRAIVSNAKCNNCHGQLGVGPSFHSGARNNGEGCALCHTANNSTSHTGADNGFGGGWNVGIKNLVHSIHSSAKRENAFTYEATAANPYGFKEVTYPGVLNNCEQCHVAGSYDFSATANAAALPNLLWTTEAKTDMTNATNAPSIGLSPWITLLGKGQVNYAGVDTVFKDANGVEVGRNPAVGNLVSSPISASCFGCHDSKLALAHMQTNGGTLYGAFSSVASVPTRPDVGKASTMTFTKVEACTVCHGAGKVADIKVVHQ